MAYSSYQSLADLNTIPAGSALVDAPNPAIIASCPRSNLIEKIGIGS